MKKLFFFLISQLLFSISFAQQAPRLLVRGDDMGYSHSGNEALIKCYQNGIEKSIEVLVPSPWFPEAVKLLKQNPGVDVGIHLDLTSEWENIKWRPLSDCPSLKDSAGYFFPMVYPNNKLSGTGHYRASLEYRRRGKRIPGTDRTGIKKYSAYQSFLRSYGLHQSVTRSARTDDQAGEGI